MLYNNLSSYLKKKYGGKIKKICIDGGFSCPNRDGTCGTGGCIFCSERGSGEHIKSRNGISEQVREYLARGRGGDGYIAYFQNFTNTYAPIDILKARYDSALIDKRIVALAIGTRPDCIDENVARLISEYKNTCDVWVELGLQSSSDETAKIINRGYSSSAFTRAVEILNKYDIPVVVHLMLGLPNEGIEEIAATCDFVNAHKIWGVKLHSVYVVKNTVLGEMYQRDEYIPLTLDQYTDYAVYMISHLRDDIILHRLTGDCAKERLLAPMWSLNKNMVLSTINQKLADGRLRQGCKYSK